MAYSVQGSGRKPTTGDSTAIASADCVSSISNQLAALGLSQNAVKHNPPAPALRPYTTAQTQPIFSDALSASAGGTGTENKKLAGDMIDFVLVNAFKDYCSTGDSENTTDRSHREMQTAFILAEMAVSNGPK